MPDHDRYPCPIHGPNPSGDASGDAFESLVGVLVTAYLVGRSLDSADHGPDGAVVTVNAQHDDEHDIFVLKIGIGQVANLIMTAEHDTQHAAGHDGGA